MAALVLIVDDDERSARLVCDVLEVAGIRTLSAPTAHEGVVLAQTHLPDVVLMDLRLPDLDGTAAARLLAEDARTAAIPVVALSAIAQEDAAGWYRDAGFAGYIEKPIDVLALPQLVRGHCPPR